MQSAMRDRAWQSKLWLMLTAVLFAAWIGWLAFQVVELQRQPRETIRVDGRETEVPVVLSRPQFLVVDFVVTAEVDAHANRPASAKVAKVHWPPDVQETEWLGQSISIDNLAASNGLAGSGSYILPLVRTGDSFRVALIPPSPGYDAGQTRIYPSTPSTREQLQQVLAARQTD